MQVSTVQWRLQQICAVEDACRVCAVQWRLQVVSVQYSEVETAAVQYSGCAVVTAGQCSRDCSRSAQWRLHAGQYSASGDCTRSAQG